MVSYFTYMESKVEFSKARQLSPDVKGMNHFFGYYSICPWSENQKYYVCLQSDFQDHMPELGEMANIILLDLEQNTHKIIAKTKVQRAAV